MGSSYIRCQKYQKKTGKDSSHIRYFTSSLSTQAFRYAQVQVFFSLLVHKHEHGSVQFLLALTTSVSVIELGDLFKIDGRKAARITVINIDDVAGVVGMVRKKEDSYIVY